MTATLLQYIIICPLVFLAGFIDAIAGGGGLISLPAYMIAGLPVHNAIGTNKLSSGMGTALATIRFGMKGYIHAKTTLPCAVTALIGSACGARLALLVDDGLFKIILLIILPLTAVYVLKSKNSLEASREPFTFSKTLLISLTAALFIGVYDGFYGPGTGTFLLLVLTGAAHMQLNSAAGTTKVINLTTNLTSLFVYLMSGKVFIILGLAAGVFSIAGNYIGTRFFTKKGGSFVRPVIIIVLSLFFIKLCLELFAGYTFG